LAVAALAPRRQAEAHIGDREEVWPPRHNDDTQAGEGGVTGGSHLQVYRHRGLGGGPQGDKVHSRQRADHADPAHARGARAGRLPDSQGAEVPSVQEGGGGPSLRDERGGRWWPSPPTR
jgi:hypothetical protein